MRCRADLLAGIGYEVEAEVGVCAIVGLERGQAAEHVPGKQVVPGMAGAVDSHAVVGTGSAYVVHVGVKPGGEARCLTCRCGYIGGEWHSARAGQQAVRHIHMRDNGAR
jgi:hypothetical protein